MRWTAGVGALLVLVGVVMLLAVDRWRLPAVRLAWLSALPSHLDAKARADELRQRAVDRGRWLLGR
ncbi:MAG TPA: hypothetical protein VK386_01420 [Acidimicrobiales bacterium]|nr:hypothetical protein [Acidimicrobiales bacterium]